MSEDAPGRWGVANGKQRQLKRVWLWLVSVAAQAEPAPEPLRIRELVRLSRSHQTLHWLQLGSETVGHGQMKRCGPFQFITIYRSASTPETSSHTQTKARRA